MANEKHAVEQDGPDVQLWLYFLCTIIFVMILVGGATRLTDSGLSITEWQPILGAIPPLNLEDWNEAFALYKQIPEYKLVNRGMSLEEFKFIYWWEWGHRFLGRMIGFAFLLPFLWFWFRGKISRKLTPKLLLMFVLGGLQGALGWYMVKSGLVDRVDVSQYRLASHLCAAILIFGYIFWVAIGLRATTHTSGIGPTGARIFATFLMLAIFMQIAIGAFVAGLDAGQGYNTWPDMDGALIPDGLFVMQPWHLNLFENAMTVQFNHRVFAYLVVAFATLHAIWIAKKSSGSNVLTGAVLLAAALWLQMGLGIATLLARVPLSLGLAHQGFAVIVFALALWHLSQLTQRPAQDRQ